MLGSFVFITTASLLSLSTHAVPLSSGVTIKTQLLSRNITSVHLSPRDAEQRPMLPINVYSGNRSGKHIITIKKGKMAGVIQSLQDKGKLSEVTTQTPFFSSFSGIFNKKTLDWLRSHPDVQRVSTDGSLLPSSTRTQSDAPWGISRISSKTALENTDSLAFRDFHYDSSAGSCADIYVVDSGIRIDHNDFHGRARHGKTFGPYDDVDNNGHGTHVAATAAGTVYGIAKLARVYSAKVYDDSNKGAQFSDVQAALQWIGERAGASRRPSIILMSMNYDRVAPELDQIIDEAVARGVHVVVSAGNTGRDGVHSSPARSMSAITVGATDIHDHMATFSNFGSVVDVYAPGVNILSAGIASRDAGVVNQGTSMAAPHVCGLVAYLSCLEGKLSPSSMKAKVQAYGLKGFVGHLPRGSGSHNILAHISTKS